MYYNDNENTFKLVDPFWATWHVCLARTWHEMNADKTQRKHIF